MHEWEENSSVADVEKVLGVCGEDQTTYNIPLTQILIQDKVLTLSCGKAASGGEDAEKSEATRDWFTGLRGEAGSAALKCEVKP